MERRYLAFFIASFAFLMLYNSLVNPPPPVNQKPQQPIADAEELPQQQAAEQQAKAPQPTPPGVEAPLPIAEELPADSPPYVPLGSVEPQGPYRLLATLDSRGATVRRMELSSLQYRDLHDRSGYLGQLELVDDAAGARIQVVGAGTPAALAGLQPEDLLLSLSTNGDEGKTAPIRSADEVRAFLAQTKPKQQVTIEYRREGATATTTAKLIRRPLDLIRPEAENIRLHSDSLPAGFQQHPSLEIFLQQVGPHEGDDPLLVAANEQLATGMWVVTQADEQRVEFRKRLPALGIEVIKRFRIPTVPAEERENANFAGYHLDFAVELRNLLAEPQSVIYQLQGPNGLPIEGWWYANKVGRSWGAYGLRDVVLRFYGRGITDYPCREIANGDVEPQGHGAPMAYMGVDAQYFSTILLPQKAATNETWYSLITPALASTRLEDKTTIRAKYENASFRLTSQAIPLAAAGSPGDQHADQTVMFAGPKHPDLLGNYHASAAPDHTLRSVVYYGWFGSIGIPQLMVGILSFFHSIVWNYGLSIVLLTILVRSLMFPLSRKQAKNMLKMQELKPEMDRITARYKDDVQARTKAQQELWAKHNYNPMGGCLLMFLQLPVFIGLYRGLMVDVDLRQAALIPGLRWCSNLAAPDMLFNWSGMWPQWFQNGEGMFALGPYLNILPLVTVLLFLLQQKMFMPPATDEQTRMTQKMMQYMMIFMSFMFFKVAAGLCLYFIASSVWGIAERKFIPRPEAATTPTTAAGTSTNNEPAPRRRRASSKTGKGSGKRKR